MSASREKKQRQDDFSTGMTEKQRRDLQESKRAKRNKVVYTILGVILVVLVAALLIWNSQFFQKRTVAATVGEHEYTVAEVSYYYANARQNVATYAGYGLFTYDTAKSAKEQIIDESTASTLQMFFGAEATVGSSFDDYFKKQALDALKQVSLLCDQAATANYTLSDDGKQQVKDSVNSIRESAAQVNYTLPIYLKAVFGKYMDQGLFERITTSAVLASEYEAHYKESLVYTDEELETYYKENAGTLDTFEYRYAEISGTPEARLDENGEAIEATEAETAAAMSAAKVKAEAMAEELRGGKDFNETAAKYVADTAKAQYADPEFHHQTADLGSAIASSGYGQWLTSNDEPRAAGDIGVAEGSGNYYVIQMIKRWRAENTYGTVDARHILVKAETTPAAEGAEDQTATVTDEQYAAAKAEIEKIQAEWEAGDKTAESFGKLATQYTEDPGSKDKGGLYEDITRNTMFAGFNDFLFAPDRKVGDVGIVQNTQAEQQGYHLILIEGLGDVYWKYQAKNTMGAEDYKTWYEEKEPNYEAVAVANGMSMVG